MTDTPTSSGLLQALCVACVDLLDMDGAGISMLTKAGVGGVVGAWGDLASQVEEWQYSLGEGPCREAFNAGEPILVDDLETDALGHTARWPVFAEVIQRAGIKAIYAFPLQVNGFSYGALDIFRFRAGRLTGEQLGVASAFAELAGPLLHAEAVAHLADANADADGDENLYRVTVHQASGMVAAQMAIPAVEALVRLRARAFVEGRTVAELADDVVSRRIRFNEEDL